MELTKSIKNYFHRVTLNELYLMNHEEEWDISYNSLLYLDMISMTEQCTGSHLAELLGISKAAVTLKVNELLKMGLVTKEQSEDDKRVFYLRVSEDAMVYYKQYKKALRHASHVVQKKYTEKEIKIFCNILDDISDEYILVMEDEK